MTVNSLFFFCLYAIFLLLMHLFIPNVGGVIAHPREYLIWLAIFTIILLSVIKVVREKTLVLPTYRIYVFLFAALLLSSSIFNPIRNMDMFIINSLHLAGGVVLWLSLHQFNLKEREKETILLIILASVIIESAIGIMQFFGLYKYIPITPSSGIAGGAFQHRKLFATWMATGLAISLYFITTGRYLGYTKKAKALFLGLVPFLSLSIVIATQRTGLLAASLAIIALLSSRKRHYLPVRKTLAVWLILFFIGLAGGYYLLGIKDKIGAEKVMEKQIKWITDTSQDSYVQRILLYKASLEMFVEKPLFGQGFGNFGSLYMYHQAKIAKAEPEYRMLIGDFTSHPHNEVFKIMSESGIAGILAILIVTAGFIRLLIKTGKEQAGLYMALLAPLLVHLMVEYPLELSTSHYLLFMIFLFMATSNSVEEKTISLKIPAAAFIISTAALLYIMASVYAIKTLYDYVNMVIYFRDQEEFISGEDRDNAKNSPLSSTHTAKETQLPDKRNKPPSELNIEGAVNNIYLRNWAKPVYMLARSEVAVRDVRENRAFIEDFLRWCDLEKQRQPIMPVFFNDARVLVYMGIQYKERFYFDEAMKTVEQGLLLYPNSEELKRLGPTIIAEALKAAYPGASVIFRRN